MAWNWPGYCDVIVERWEKFTGKKAQRIAAREETHEKTPAAVDGIAGVNTGEGA